MTPKHQETAALSATEGAAADSAHSHGGAPEEPRREQRPAVHEEAEAWGSATVGARGAAAHRNGKNRGEKERGLGLDEIQRWLLVCMNLKHWKMGRSKI